MSNYKHYTLDDWIQCINDKLEYFDGLDGNEMRDLADFLSNMKQQKVTGSWVEKQVVDNEEVEIEQWQSARCSKCDKYHTTPYSYYFDEYSYCPNCGAKWRWRNDKRRK